MKCDASLRIYVDFPWDASACMGTGAYSETMVRALAQAAPASAITLIVPLGTPRRVFLPNVSYASLPTTEGLNEGARQVALPAYLDAVKADCLFAPASLLPAVKTCPMVATILDLAFETHSELYAPHLVEYLCRWFPVTLSNADRIVAISDPVKQDLLFRKRVSPERVTVIEPPIRHTFLQQLSDSQIDAELEKLRIKAPFFFHVSNLAAHKNMEFGIRAFAEFLRRHPGATHDLVFAGGGYAPSVPPDLATIAGALGIGNRVKYAGKISDGTLKALYQRCEAFLFPSLVEGWGLPVVEARTMGAKVLASPHVPSANLDERFPLDQESWVSALSSAAQNKSVTVFSPLIGAGERLLGVILEAIQAYRADNPQGMRNHGETMTSSSLGPLVAIRGDWHSPSGLGEAARGVFEALESAGVSPICSAVPRDAIQRKNLWRRNVSLRREPADLWIHHLPLDHVDLSLQGKHASFFFWETDRLPTSVPGCDWANVLASLDEIWVPSTFVADVLKESGVSAPIFQAYPPVDTQFYSPGTRRRPPIDLPDRFDPSWTVVLYVGTWDPRKRPDLLVRSFCRAFSAADNAILVIKSYVTGDESQDRRILDQWIAQCRESSAHIRFIPEVLPAEAMADLLRFATVFATASRGEGYCLPAVQAMSSGKPVIAPKWSAFQDYVAVPVDFQLEQVPANVTLPGYSPDQRWAAVDQADLSRKLRWIHEHRDAARRLGNESRDWVLANASMSVVGGRLRDRIESLCGKRFCRQLLEVVQ